MKHYVGSINTDVNLATGRIIRFREDEVKEMRNDAANCFLVTNDGVHFSCLDIIVVEPSFDDLEEICQEQ